MIPRGFLPANVKYCVAGGWAACPALAADKDVFVYGVPTEALNAMRDRLIEFVSSGEDQVIASDETLEETEYSGVSTSILKVATIWVHRYFAQPVHLMVTDAPNPGALLHNFDVSTHAVAIDCSGAVITHPQFTPPHVPPVAILDNEKTADRMARIRARFGHVNRAEMVLDEEDCPF